MLAQRPSWLPPKDHIRSFFQSTMAYSFYKIQLVEYIARTLPETGPCQLLDVGAGDGYLSAFIAESRPQTTVVGIDTVIRNHIHPKVSLIRFDGVRIPFPDRSFDIALACNVLHHAEAPFELFDDMLRVTRRLVVIKDHVAETRLQHFQLRVLDQLGNRRFGVDASGAYLSWREWQSLFRHHRILEVLVADRLRMRRGLMAGLFGNQLEVLFELRLP